MSDQMVSIDSAMLLSIMDSIPDVIFYKDTEGAYQYGNRAWGELLGRPVGEILGKTDFDLFPNDVATLFREKDQDMLASRQSQHNHEQLKYPDGHCVMVDTVKTPVFDENGDLIGLVGVCRDMSGRTD